jgi:hypothetical protein
MVQRVGLAGSCCHSCSEISGIEASTYRNSFNFHDLFPNISSSTNQSYVGSRIFQKEIRLITGFSCLQINCIFSMQIRSKEINYVLLPYGGSPFDWSSVRLIEQEISMVCLFLILQLPRSTSNATFSREESSKLITMILLLCFHLFKPSFVERWKIIVLLMIETIIPTICFLTSVLPRITSDPTFS